MLNPVRPDEWAYYEPLQGDSMFELGGKVNGSNTYKAYFESLGFRHVSVDFEGVQYGALNLDLRKPLWGRFGQFDMVTNIGTTEHVQGQAGVWENIHRLTKPGGVFVSVTPYPDGLNWWWHGNHYPLPEFFQAFAELNGWVIDRIGDDLPPPNRNLYVRMIKGDDESEFIMPDESLIHFNHMRSRHDPP